MKRKEIPKERNPFVEHLTNRKGAGFHGKSKKAIRRKEKILLQKQSFAKKVAG
jgi:hypothetical protein